MRIRNPNLNRPSADQACALRMRFCSLHTYVISNIIYGRTTDPLHCLDLITMSSLNKQTKSAFHHLPRGGLISLRHGRSATAFVQREVVALDIGVCVETHPIRITLPLIQKYFAVANNTFVLTKGVYPKILVRLITANFISFPHLVLTRSGRTYGQIIKSKPNWLIKSVLDSLIAHKAWRRKKSINLLPAPAPFIDNKEEYENTNLYSSSYEKESSYDELEYFRSESFSD